MCGKYSLFYKYHNNLGYYTHAQTVSIRPLFRGVVAWGQGYRWQCTKLPRDELNMVLMEQIMATVTMTECTKFQHTLPHTENTCFNGILFFHGRDRICGKTFRKLH